MKTLRSYLGWGESTVPEPSKPEPSKPEQHKQSIYYNYQEPQQDKIVLLVPRYYNGSQEKSENLSIIYEGVGIFKVYARIVELYETRYNKVCWVIQTDNYDITRGALEMTQIKGNIYEGDSGLERAMNELGEINE